MVRKIVTPLLARPVDQIVDVARGDRVEAGGRLVQEEHLRIVEQGPGQTDPLAQPLGQLAADIVGPSGEVDGTQGTLDALAASGNA